MKSKGFTLLEILITVGILALVAALAVPVFSSTLEEARKGEARTNLGVILMAEKIYRVRNGGYWVPGGTSAANINTNLNLDLTPNYYNSSWNISGDANTFTARVCRGGAGTPRFNITEAGGDATQDSC